MLMSDSKKKNLVQIIVSRHSKKEPSESVIQVEKKTDLPGIEKDYSPGYEAAADEIISAVNSNDPTAFVDGLKNFLEMWKSDCEEEESSTPSFDTEEEE